MDDYEFMFGSIGLVLGFIFATILFIGVTRGEKPKISGSYLTYDNVIYKKIDEEELDNIIILEVK